MSTDCSVLPIMVNKDEYITSYQHHVVELINLITVVYRQLG